MAHQCRDIAPGLSMAPETELDAVERVEAAAAFTELTRDQIDEVKVALVEACLHVSRLSDGTDGAIDVYLEVNPAVLTIQVVTDVQAGPTEGCECCREWSLAIMRELMDEVALDTGEGQLVITLTKRA